MSLGKSDTAAGGPMSASLCRIVDVDNRRYTATVDTVYTNRDGIPDIPLSCMYAHQRHGGGGYVMPEPGAHCYLFESSDGTKFLSAFVLNPTTKAQPSANPDGSIGMTGGDEGPDFSGARPLLENGDIHFCTADGNFMILKRGGILQLGATALSQRLYLPIEDLIRDYCRKYEMLSPLGEVKWGHATLVAPGEDQETGVLIQGSWYENAQDTEFAVEVRLGKLDGTTLDTESDGEHVFADGKTTEGYGVLPDNTAGVVSLTINARDTEAVTYKFQLDRDGNHFVAIAGHVHVEAAKSVFVNIAEKCKVEFGASSVEMTAATDTLKVLVQQMVFEQLANLLVTTASLTLNVGGTVISAAGGVVGVTGGVVNIGPAGGQPVLVDRGSILEVLRDHKHLVQIPGGPVLLSLASQTLTGVTSARSTILRTS